MITEKLFNKIHKEFNKETMAFDITGDILESYVNEMREQNIILDYLEARIGIIEILQNVSNYKDL